MEKNSDYKALINRHAPSSLLLKNSISAFLIGGVICLLGEIMRMVFSLFLTEKRAYLLVTLTFIIVASVLTALGVYDKLARYAGAGTLVPVSGFSNSVTSAAIDSRSEGFVTGVGAKIFTVAGPVVLYSTVAGTVYGLIYWLYLMLV